MEKAQSIRRGGSSLRDRVALAPIDNTPVLSVAPSFLPIGKVVEIYATVPKATRSRIVFCSREQHIHSLAAAAFALLRPPTKSKRLIGTLLKIALAGAHSSTSRPTTRTPSWRYAASWVLGELILKDFQQGGWCP